MSQHPDLPPGTRRLSADDLYWEEVEAARRQSMEEKLLAGPDLFDLGCERIRARIHDHFPDADETLIQRMLDAVLRLHRRSRHG